LIPITCLHSWRKWVCPSFPCSARLSFCFSARGAGSKTIGRRVGGSWIYNPIFDAANWTAGAPDPFLRRRACTTVAPPFVLKNTEAKNVICAEKTRKLHNGGAVVFEVEIHVEYSKDGDSAKLLGVNFRVYSTFQCCRGSFDHRAIMLVAICAELWVDRENSCSWYDVGPIVHTLQVSSSGSCIGIMHFQRLVCFSIWNEVSPPSASFVPWRRLVRSSLME